MPTPVSIGYGFAQKQIGGATVVACVVCGGNYGLEWASNLTIGETIRSEGFGVSGGKVQEALKAYLDAHPSGNPLKLWEEMGRPESLNRGEAQALTDQSCVRPENWPFTWENGTLTIRAELGVNDVYGFVIR